MDFHIDKQWSGNTVKEFLFSALFLSSKTVTRLKKNINGILRNGEHVTVRALLREGDLLSLAMEDQEQEQTDCIPVNIPLQILFEDEHLLAVNKPSGIPSHPSHGHQTDTLANAVLWYYRNRPFVYRCINRLDADTSGVVLIAKNRMIAYQLGKQMQMRSIRKEYLAVLQGTLPQSQGVIDAPIQRKEGSTMLREVAPVGSDAAQSAITRYQVLWKKDGLCGVKAIPITGRTHQLRVHFSFLGAPVLYDPFYGKEHQGKRLCLHAHILEFVHPLTKETVRIEAPLCPQLQSIWEGGTQNE